MDILYHASTNKELEVSEQVSKISVNPIDKTIYETSLDAIYEMGVNIYFVSYKQFEEIIDTRDENHIISKLAPY